MKSIFPTIGSILLALGVGLGAFGAHGLKGTLSDYGMAIFEKAVFYHFIHSIGILVVALCVGSSLLADSYGKWVCSLLTFGVLVFCGSLYTLAITEIKWLGAITPIGGLAFIIAWTVLAVGFYQAAR